ncbi:hypothetical protein ACFPVT_00570 [Corynebacterium choanae]|uniref:hypothetical protein n=1 Tax=Corynebacterium choanae TaxID=1862358 RepID=UPI0013DD8AD3|nr:hypothetical protein [Corynebacterium choanae]
MSQPARGMGAMLLRVWFTLAEVGAAGMGKNRAQDGKNTGAAPQNSLSRSH